jgi:hypothetical protein
MNSEEWPDKLKLPNDIDRIDEISNHMQAHPNDDPSEYTVFVKEKNDGRPMDTDDFLEQLLVACDDHKDRQEAIEEWLCANWSEAMEYLK